jgi:hypothetical protein
MAIWLGHSSQAGGNNDTKILTIRLAQGWPIATDPSVGS